MTGSEISAAIIIILIIILVIRGRGCGCSSWFRKTTSCEPKRYSKKIQKEMDAIKEARDKILKERLKKKNKKEETNEQNKKV